MNCWGTARRARTPPKVDLALGAKNLSIRDIRVKVCLPGVSAAIGHRITRVPSPLISLAQQRLQGILAVAGWNAARWQVV